MSAPNQFIGPNLHFTRFFPAKSKLLLDIHTPRPSNYSGPQVITVQKFIRSESIEMTEIESTFQNGDSVRETYTVTLYSSFIYYVMIIDSSDAEMEISFIQKAIVDTTRNYERKILNENNP